MNKYERLKADLEKDGTGTMKCFGNSMLPIMKSGSEVTFQVEEDYEVGEIVFCRVKGRYIDAHLIKAKNEKRGWLIANNHGHLNGWTKTIYGRVIKAEYNGEEKTFERKPVKE
jgi:hypothetical protein